MRHAQRREDPLRRELRVGHATHPLDDRAQQQESGVRVRVEISNRIIDRLLPSHNVEHIVLGVQPCAARPALPFDEIAPLAQSTRVGQQMANRDRSAVGRQLGDDGARIVFKTQLAITDKQHDGGRGELFRDGARFQNRRRRDRSLADDIGHAVAAREQNRAAARDADRAARAMGGVPRCKGFISDGDQIRRLGLARRGNDREREGRGDERSNQREIMHARERTNAGAFPKGRSGGLPLSTSARLRALTVHRI